MSKPRRVLITGGRDWSDESQIAAVIQSMGPDDLLIVGDCKTGADAIATTLADEHLVDVEIYHADWNSNGVIAGPIRNSRMVNEGKPTEAHAFPTKNSRGTYDCARKCERAGVPVKYYSEGK